MKNYQIRDTIERVPCMTTPCKDCPFRKDSLRGWLGGRRITEILEADSFVCHKTLKGTYNDRRQCAGHMLLKKDENKFYQLASRLGCLPVMTGEELIFEDNQDCIEHHSTTS